MVFFLQISKRKEMSRALYFRNVPIQMKSHVIMCYAYIDIIRTEIFIKNKEMNSTFLSLIFYGYAEALYFFKTHDFLVTKFCEILYLSSLLATKNNPD